MGREELLGSLILFPFSRFSSPLFVLVRRPPQVEFKLGTSPVLLNSRSVCAGRPWRVPPSTGKGKALLRV